MVSYMKIFRTVKHKRHRNHEDLLDRLIKNEKFCSILMGTGIFIKDYTNGKCIPNTIWKELGYSTRDMRMNRWFSYVHPEDLSLVRQFVNDLLSGNMDAWAGEYRVRDKAGFYHTLLHKALILERNKAGIPSLYVGYDVDISEFKQRLDQANMDRDYNKTLYFRSEAIRTAGIILASELDPENAAEQMLSQARMILDFDAAAVRAIDESESFILASEGFKNEGLPENIPPQLMRQQSIQVRTPVVYTPDTGPYRSMMIVPLYKRNILAGYLDFYSYEKDAFFEDDIAGAMLYAEQASIAFSNALRYRETEMEAASDWLTGLPTRRAFMAKISRLSLESSKDDMLAVMMIDLDFFKAVNDNYGHQVGDSFLIAVASGCREVLRSQDICCRYGGEEILVFLPGADESTALAAAERIRDRISRLHIIEAPELRITVSVGVSAGTFEQDFRELIRYADEALYMAKESGRNRCESR